MTIYAVPNDLLFNIFLGCRDDLIPNIRRVDKRFHSLVTEFMLYNAKRITTNSQGAENYLYRVIKKGFKVDNLKDFPSCFLVFKKIWLISNKMGITYNKMHIYEPGEVKDLSMQIKRQSSDEFADILVLYSKAEKTELDQTSLENLNGDWEDWEKDKAEWDTYNEQIAKIESKQARRNIQKPDPLKQRAFYLSELKLEVVPSEIFEITSLTILDLSSNEIQVLSREIEKLVHLKVLKLSKNALQSLPSEIGKLPSLEELNLSENQIVGLPHEISNLKKLDTLKISKNRIVDLSEISQLTSLVHLDVSENALTSFPLVAQCTCLKILLVFKNNITEIPEFVGQFAELERLDVSGNKITELPDSIMKLEKLCQLNISDNQFTQLSCLKNAGTILELLDISMNPIKEYPDRLFEIGLKSVTQYILDFYSKPSAEPAKPLTQQEIASITDEDMELINYIRNKPGINLQDPLAVQRAMYEYAVNTFFYNEERQNEVVMTMHRLAGSPSVDNLMDWAKEQTATNELLVLKAISLVYRRVVKI